ncbi:MAG: methyl-accepting chemotaxis protein [Bacillota bacterium]
MFLNFSLKGRLIARVIFLSIVFILLLGINYNNIIEVSDTHYAQMALYEDEKNVLELKYRMEMLFENQEALLASKKSEDISLREKMAGVESNINYLTKRADTDEEIKMAGNLEAYSKKYMEYAGKASDEPGLIQELDKNKKNITGIIEYFAQNYGSKRIEITERLNNIIRTVYLSIMGTFILFAVLYVIMSMLLAVKFTRPMKSLVTAAKRASSGDLTQEIPVTSNEIGLLAEAFKGMIYQIRELITQIAHKTAVLSGSAQQLNSISNETTAGAVANAATIREISLVVDQITSNINEISVASETASEQARQGRTGIEKIVGQMQVIAGSSGEMSKVICGLNNKTQKIGQIVELITSIADQTNLLALNAAIEAARAGQQGKGFVVVAEEVKKLAERSAAAAKDIHSIISDIQLESQRAVLSMAEGDREVEAGSSIVGEVGENLNEIINAVQNLTSQIKNVSLAALQLSAGVQDVTGSTEVQKVTMKKVSDHAGSLSGLAEELNLLVGKFKVEV